ncbi:ABC transporter ATP-binding protein [Puniceibacterium confluentis]|uniref:ABC transporter ATP-binding protein n=1 Tax=Puniceibacterium confluentis TaxID=1958944 RepID=UPI0011B3CDE7|nr:ATP-binding cassette domain-containing protein [Puniceibacterium confluentis]
MAALPLALRNVTVTAASGRGLLNIPDYTLPAGQSLAILGPSGAGKSTLLHVLSGLRRVSTGSVHWGATDLATLTETRLSAFRRRHIGQIFQDFLLFDEMSALENAAVARQFAPGPERAEILRRAVQSLTSLGLDPQETRRATTYSGGERQRIAVARALAQGPDVLLADEPTASLDRTSAERLTDDLLAAAQRTGLSLICVTHDPALATRLDRTLRLAHGAPEMSHAA